jgi:2-C-methyl-D-erythritol 4-phosphate cytidylyltransferase / 2-C-methyl-D-erythritol 2,4-cyclodiphosphate synthase
MDSTDARSGDPVEAVVVAAGASRRMSGQDKLDAELEGRSVLRWSVEALAAAGVRRIVIATSPARVAEIAALPWLTDAVVAVVAGGDRRQESVAAGVAALAGFPAAGVRPAVRRVAGGARGEAAAGAHGGTAAGAATPLQSRRIRPIDPVILVHDAARPLVSPDLVRAVARAAAAYGAAIPVLPVAETLKRLDGDLIGATVDRTDVVAAQTPQGLRLSLLERAYAEYPPDGPETWTDEASLLEACRISVHAISGEASNLKVTVPVDLERARALLDAGLVAGRPGAPLEAGRSTASAAPLAALPGPAELRAAGRIGLGIDSHPFGPGEPLVLGGLRIDGAPRLAGHSDGDVALHAVADALLGAAGLGDLGRLFPADARTPAGIDSRVLLATVAEKVRAAGWIPANVDVTIVAARPRLGGLLPAMGEAIAAALGVETATVNVKASTGNLEGPEGAGRSISASAIALLVPVAGVAAGGAVGATAGSAVSGAVSAVSGAGSAVSGAGSAK